jgi:hypothetical protein
VPSLSWPVVRAIGVRPHRSPNVPADAIAERKADEAAHKEKPSPPEVSPNGSDNPKRTAHAKADRHQHPYRNRKHSEENHHPDPLTFAVE